MFRFLNHSSFIMDSILVDPWFKDSIFLNGWNLLKEFEYDINKMYYEYIFISHEHPDHFHIPTLKQIKHPNLKTIIFHKTLDKKVIEFVKKMGFKTIECENNHWYDLPFGKIMVHSNGFDSMYVYKTKSGKTIVNMNDYQIKDEDELAQFGVTDIDYLFSQFSYANWAGNKGDALMPKKAQSIIYDRLSTQFKVFKPKTWIPFASFVYFSHEENFYMNKYTPDISDIKRFADTKNVKCIFPTPDMVHNERMGDNALQYWTTMKKMATVKHKNSVQPLEEVKESFQKMCDELHYYNDMSLFDAEETYIKVTDWKNVIKYDIKSRVFEIVSQLENDIEMSSECLHFLIKNKWGRGTVLISGRCQINYEKANNFFNQTNLWYNNNIGKYLGKNLSLKEVVNQDNFYQRLIGDL